MTVGCSLLRTPARDVMFVKNAVSLVRSRRCRMPLLLQLRFLGHD